MSNSSKSQSRRSNGFTGKQQQAAGSQSKSKQQQQQQHKNNSTNAAITKSEHQQKMPSSLQATASASPGSPIASTSSSSSGAGQSAQSSRSDKCRSESSSLSGGSKPISISNLGTLQFSSGNPNVEVTSGLLHFYKETKLTSPEEECERSQLVLLQQVPLSVGYNELLQFTGPVNSSIERMRIIRDSRPNQYMALIKFRGQRAADEFFINFNGVQFNAIEPHVCSLVYVERLESITDDNRNCNVHGELLLEAGGEPTSCPVCLEKLDQKDANAGAILTTLCNHSFHGTCLLSWSDQSCPICRYALTPETVTEQLCFECGTHQESLWLCITCGHIGCGRYIEGHAYRHFEQTSHNFVMLVGQSNKVWDYAADNYVHRLLQTNDGKPVEVVGNSNELHEKIDSIQLEYTYLLTNQLESQRAYYEQQILRAQTDAQAQIDEVLDKAKIVTEEKEKLEERMKEVAREHERLVKRLAFLEPKYREAISELRDEKEINKCLRENLNEFTTQLSEKVKDFERNQLVKEQQIADLNEQLRDLMFSIEAQAKLREFEDVSNEEIQQGQIIVGESSASDCKADRSKAKSKAKKK